VKACRVIYSCTVKPLAREDLEHILSLTSPLWDAARGRRVFLSGGTGFFGAWLLESFAFCNRSLHAEMTATVLTRDPAAFRLRMPHIASEPAIELVRGDVRDFSFPAHNYDYVIHAAAPTGAVAPGTEIRLLDMLIDGTRRMLRFADERNAKRFLFVSSGAVYGRQPEHLERIPETYGGGPAWLETGAVYGEGKRVAEQMCALTAKTSQIEFSIARCFAFVGPHLPLDQHFAIGNFIGDVLAGRTLSIQGDGTPMRSYLYAADLAIWLWTLLLTGNPAQGAARVVNVGSSQALSIRGVAEAVAHVLNPALKIEVARAAVVGAPVQRYVPDVQRAEQLLDLRQTIGLEEAIRRTAAWYREGD
jgi:nucleoside-diphosphate-sugar epimerase